MMNASDRKFLKEHRNHIRKTLSLVKRTDLTRKPDELSIMGLSTAMMNMYSGMEVMIRHILITSGINITKSSSWHKDLLNLAVKHKIISSDLKDKLKDYLDMRHRHIHGYGYMDDWRTIKVMASKIEMVVDSFLSEFEKNGYA